jgi:hypothetical protein
MSSLYPIIMNNTGSMNGLHIHYCGVPIANFHVTLNHLIVCKGNNMADEETAPVTNSFLARNA